jgi:nucleoside-diphosphate-sugar epimerase
MGRALRIEYPGAFYHATSHGNEQKEVFKTNRDREKFLSYLEKEIIVAICQALGRTPPRFSVPVGPAHFLAGLMEDTFRFVGRKSPIGRDTIDKYTEDIAVDSQLIQGELGFKPQFDLKTGWEETVEEMRCTGDLKF